MESTIETEIDRERETRERDQRERERERDQREREIRERDQREKHSFTYIIHGVWILPNLLFPFLECGKVENVSNRLQIVLHLHVSVYL